MSYFVLPSCNIAFNAKVASSALACSIVRKYYPERLKNCLDEYERTWSMFSQEFKDSLPESFQKMFRNDKLNSQSFWQNLCIRTFDPVGDVLLLVREPVDRFLSTVAYLGLDVDDTLRILENDEYTVLERTNIRLRANTHFLTQCGLMRPNTRLYRFPDGLERMCLDAGLDWPLEKVNEGKNVKPVLTDEQVSRIRDYYADDVRLYSSL